MAQDMPGETARDTGDDVLERLQTLVDDDDRKGPSIHRLAYAERLSAAYHEIEAAVTDVLDRPTWDDQTQEWVVARLRLISLLTTHYARAGEHADQHREWGDRALELGRSARPPYRAALLLALSEIERARGDRPATAQRLKSAAELLSDAAENDAVAQTVLAELRLRMGILATATGDREKARREFETVLVVQPDPGTARAYAQMNLALLASTEDRLDDAFDLESEAAETAYLAGDHDVNLWARNNKACTLLQMGKIERAYAAFLDLLPDVLWEIEPQASAVVAEDFATVLVGLRRHEDAALILGAVAAQRETTVMPREPHQADALGPVEAEAQEALGDRWPTLLGRGRELTVGDAVRRVTG